MAAVTENAAIAPTRTVIEKQVQRRIFKIIVIGDSNVGKTCLTFRFCGGRFPDKTEATIGVDFREKSIQVDGEIIKVNLFLCSQCCCVKISVNTTPVTHGRMYRRIATGYQIWKIVSDLRVIVFIREHVLAALLPFIAGYQLSPSINKTFIFQ